VSTNESRPVYMGTLFEIENNVLTMVSVDGYRLARSTTSSRSVRAVLTVTRNDSGIAFL